jgi:hypothetical protein
LTLPVVPRAMACLNVELRMVMFRESWSLTQPFASLTVSPSTSTYSRFTIVMPMSTPMMIGVSLP